MTADRDLLIVALPWQRFDTTSIQLGALQAWLRRSGYLVDTRHYYKDLIAYTSPATYLRVFEAYMGESVFAAMMFPERYEQIKEAVVASVDFDLSVTDGAAVLKHPQLSANLSPAERQQMASVSKEPSPSRPTRLDFDELSRALKTFLDDVYEATPWQRYKVISFTTSHQQLIPTVLLARRLKEALPDTPIVIGGALMTQGLPRTVLEFFECFDIVVEGEGEETAAELMGVLTGDDTNQTLSDIAGIVWRRRGPDGEEEIVSNPSRPAMADLDQLPTPDYDDYFKHALRPDSIDVIPKIAVEASRACVWGKCAYCNLNLQWQNLYRRKSHSHVIEELTELRSRHGSPYVTLCDTNVEDKVQLFEQLAEDPYDYRILAEVSPNISRVGMRAMRDAGVRTIQVGIESFSDRILSLYQRNHRLMRSLEVLKWACEYDVEIYYNIIINFPAEESADVERSMKVIDYAQHFMYPAVHDYSFTVDSPAWKNMASYNISGWKLPDEVSAVYPEKYAQKFSQLLALTIKPVPAIDNGVDWSPFLAALDGWKRRFHANLGRPGLVYVDGGTFLNVTIRSGGQGNDVVINLPDEYRDIYLACIDESRTLEEICAAVPAVPSADVAQILQEMHDLRILFSERHRHLALAVRERNVGNYPLGERFVPGETRRPTRQRLGSEPPETRTKEILHRPRSKHAPAKADS